MQYTLITQVLVKIILQCGVERIRKCTSSKVVRLLQRSVYQSIVQAADSKCDVFINLIRSSRLNGHLVHDSVQTFDSLSQFCTQIRIIR